MRVETLDCNVFDRLGVDFYDLALLKLAKRVEGWASMSR